MKKTNIKLAFYKNIKLWEKQQIYFNVKT